LAALNANPNFGAPSNEHAPLAASIFSRKTENRTRRINSILTPGLRSTRVHACSGAVDSGLRHHHPAPPRERFDGFLDPPVVARLLDVAAASPADV